MKFLCSFIKIFRIMDIYEFQKLSEKIPFFLDENEKEERIIQITDLKHFTECYDSEMKIIDCTSNKINIVEYQNQKIGILFCELKKVNDTLSYYETFYDICHTTKSKTEELWFVFVEENSTSNFRQFIDFIEEHKLSSLFDKIFLFQFFQSVINQLK